MIDTDAPTASDVWEARLEPIDDGLQPGGAVGRYRVLAPLGQGGMGVVLLAHDPQLDRNVALKVLLPGHSGRTSIARTRLIREAQAMAALSHPNVATVLDVGAHGDRVFIAMEYIRGLSLRELLEQRRPQPDAVIALFRQAARGLAAAHRAALVHRDFKPDNVMVDQDGRVVVLDFGLARAARNSSEEGASEGPLAAASSRGLRQPGDLDRSLTAAGVVMGTPAYMAPEQHKGNVVPQSDQFALCASLYEALYGQRPFAGRDLHALASAKLNHQVVPQPTDVDVPPRVRAAIERGLLPDPDQRYATMDELVDALAPRAGRRGRWMLASAGAGALVSTIAVLGQTPTVVEHACEPAVSPWRATQRAAVAEGFARSDAPYVAHTSSAVLAALDTYAAAISDDRLIACRASYIDGTQSAADLDLRTACLHRREQELTGMLDLLAVADVRVVERAAEAVQSLSPVEACSDLTNLRAAVPLPEDPGDRVRLDALRPRFHAAVARVRAGTYEDARGMIVELLGDAQALGYDPFIAETHDLLGEVLHKLGEFEAARTQHEHAATVATRSRHDRVAVSAHRNLAWTVGVSLGHPEDAEPRLRAAEALIEGLGAPPDLVADLMRTRAVLAHDAGNFEAAIAMFSRARAFMKEHELDLTPSLLTNMARTHAALRQRTESEAMLREAALRVEQRSGPGHPDIAKVQTQIAQLHLEAGEIGLAAQAHARALEIRERALGPDHQLVAHSYNNLAGVLMMQGEIGRAREYYDKARVILTRVMGEEHPDIGRMTLNIAELYKMEGRYSDAEQEYSLGLARLQSTLGQTHPDVGRAQNNLASVMHDSGDLPRAAAAYRLALYSLEQALGPEHSDLAYPLVGIGQAEGSLGNHEPAIAALERALKLREAGDGIDPIDLADTRFALARSLWDSKRDRARAIALGSAARSAYAAADEGRTTSLDEATQWLAAASKAR